MIQKSLLNRQLKNVILFLNIKTNTMKEFLLLYRADQNAVAQRSPEEMQASMQQWMDWLGSIAAQNQLTDKGNRLVNDGKVLKAANIVTDGPFTELKEALGGYSIIKAPSLQEATELAKGCPILKVGGSVEIREIDKM